MTDPTPIVKVDGTQIQPTRWILDITNRVEPTEPPTYALNALDIKLPAFEATFDVDSETYDRIVGAAPTYTIEISTDHNPWHRTATGWRARLRKLRDGIWWTFQRRLLRRQLIGRTTVTIPNCQVTSGV